MLSSIPPSEPSGMGQGCSMASLLPRLLHFSRRETEMKTQRSPSSEGGGGQGGVPGAGAVPKKPREKLSHLPGYWKYTAPVLLWFWMFLPMAKVALHPWNRAGVKEEPSRDQYSLNLAVSPHSPSFLRTSCEYWSHLCGLCGCKVTQTQLSVWWN